jgi:hypothetical protein
MDPPSATSLLFFGGAVTVRLDGSAIDMLVAT